MNEIIKLVLIILLPLLGYAIGEEGGATIGFIIAMVLMILKVL